MMYWNKKIQHQLGTPRRGHLPLHFKQQNFFNRPFFQNKNKNTLFDNLFYGCKYEPLFHAYRLYHRVLPSGLTRNGPSSVIAPAPMEEQPGPAVSRIIKIAKRRWMLVHRRNDNLNCLLFLDYNDLAKIWLGFPRRVVSFIRFQFFSGV